MPEVLRKHGRLQPGRLGFDSSRVCQRVPALSLATGPHRRSPFRPGPTTTSRRGPCVARPAGRGVKAREVTMPRKVCAEPGCPTLTDRTRCTTHERAKDRARGTRQERGYDADHDREAKRWRDAVRRGELVTCWRCGDPITDPNDCHLGHDDHDRRVTRGPEHGRGCNLSAAGRARHGISPDD